MILFGLDCNDLVFEMYLFVLWIEGEGFFFVIVEVKLYLWGLGLLGFWDLRFRFCLFI